jgi:hypothetical protein
MPWKYGLIKVAGEDPLTAEPECMVVELYDIEKHDEYTSYCLAHLDSLFSLKLAVKDIERDGVNEYFYNNGSFKYDSVKGTWIYTSKEGWQNPPDDPDDPR